MHHLDFTSWWFTPVISAPVFGHAFSPFWKGKGGKAIAVSFGVLLGLLPWYHVVFALATLYIFLSIGVVINPHRLRSIATYTLFAIYCVYAYWLQGRLETSIFCGCLLCALLSWASICGQRKKRSFKLRYFPRCSILKVRYSRPLAFRQLFVKTMKTLGIRHTVFRHEKGGFLWNFLRKKEEFTP